MRSLYVTQTGMAENLGQSQVLPYLRGLARRGVAIDLVSYELASLPESARAALADQMTRDGIRWHPLVRKMPGSLAVKAKESALGVLTAIGSALRGRPDIIHGRSYLPSAIADVTAGLSRAKVLFDCRGMLGDEYVDGGYWTTDRREYRLLKRYERRLFRRSDGVVVLTRALRRWLETESTLLAPAPRARPRIEVIPCCVDLERFRPFEADRVRLRSELGLGDRVVVTYSGSLGNWYLEPEMARFAAAIRGVLGAQGKQTAFVCLTPSDASGLRGALDRAGFPSSDVIVRKVPPAQMAASLNAGDIGLSFIQSCFSKKGSSPTKVAEYLACGHVAVVNGDIGDQADLAAEHTSCVVLDDFGAGAIDAAAHAAAALVIRPWAERCAAGVATARRHFGLEEVGVARYAALYEHLARGGGRP